MLEARERSTANVGRQKLENTQESRSSWSCSALRQRSPRPRPPHSALRTSSRLPPPRRSSIFGLSIFVLAVTAAIFVVVFTLLAYSVVKFRKRKNDDGREPPQVYGSNQVEVAWTVIPILIVVALFMATARVIAAYRTGPFTI